MRGNIRVFCRCRRDDRAATALTFPSDNELQLTTQQGHVKKFEFEKVFGPASTQVEVRSSHVVLLNSAGVLVKKLLYRVILYHATIC